MLIFFLLNLLSLISNKNYIIVKIFEDLNFNLEFLEMFYNQSYHVYIFIGFIG